MDKELTRKVSQLFMIGVNELDLREEEENFIREFQPGGIILFAKNYDTPAQVGELINSIQDLKEDVPFLISVDQEGGRVQRFKAPFTVMPPAIAFGKLNSPKVAFEGASIMARELAAVGVNLDFTPVCDINTNPDNPVIGDRAFGDTEEVVSHMATAFVRGFHTQGVWSCAKHFPGHGDTNVDSHFGLPTVETPVETMTGRELAPFYKTFRAKVEMVMMAHIINRNIDPEFPASLSEKTIRQYVRETGRFERLIVTDDMEMKAVADHWGLHEASVLAIRAGNDMVIYRSFENGIKAIETCVRAVEEGRLPRERIEESYARIMDMKKNHLRYKRVVVPDISSVVGRADHKIFADALAKGNTPPNMGGAQGWHDKKQQHGQGGHHSQGGHRGPGGQGSGGSRGHGGKPFGQRHPGGGGFPKKNGFHNKGLPQGQKPVHPNDSSELTIRAVNADLNEQKNEGHTTLTGKTNRDKRPGNFGKPHGFNKHKRPKR